MKVRFNRWYNAVLTALLSMLGFGCSSSDDQTFVAEYGMPVFEYQVRGQVTDEAGTPVQGIKVSQKLIFLSADGKKDILGIDSILTDTSGRYQLNSYGSNNYKKLFVEDVDGEANGGEFLSDTLDIDFEKAVKTDDKYSYELNMDIKLKKK